MPELFRTTKDKKHNHILYMRDDGTGTTSVDNGHSHEWRITQTQEEIMNPITGMMEILMRKETGMSVVNGHTHGLKEKEKIEISHKEDKDDKEIIADVVKLYEESKEYEQDNIDAGIESEKMYMADQWKSEDRSALESDNRPVLTMNFIRSTLNVLFGYESQTRTEWKFLPVEQGDVIVSDILAQVAKNVADQNVYSRKKSEVFADECIVGRGWIQIFADYSENALGDIKIEKLDWESVVCGWHDEKDLSDCENLTKRKWYSKDKAKKMYPQFAEEIDAMFQGKSDSETPKSVEQIDSRYDDYDDPNLTSTDINLIDRSHKKVLLMETQRKEYERKHVFIENNEVAMTKSLSTSDFKSVQTIPGVKVVEVVKPIMRVTVTLGKDVLISDEYPEWPIMDFNVVPFYAYKRKAIWHGKVEDAKDPQREINKRHSQSVDIINKMANYIEIFDDQTFENQNQTEAYRKGSAKAGSLLKVADITRPPIRREGVKIPNEVLQLENISLNNMREILNINPEMLGMKSQATSGAAIRERRQGALMGNEFLFDNAFFADKKVGKAVASWIQKIYTPERILRILVTRNQKSPVKLGGQQFDDQNPEQLQAIYTLLTETDLMKYDVVVEESKYSPTQRRMNFWVWSELAQTRPDIPTQFLLQLDDDMSPESKAEYMGIMQQQQQAQMQMEQQKGQTEIQKTQVAAQGKMQVEQMKQAAKPPML